MAEAAMTTLRPSTTLRKAMSTKGCVCSASRGVSVKVLSGNGFTRRRGDAEQFFSPRPPRLRVKRFFPKPLYCRQNQFGCESIWARSRRAFNNQSINVFSEDPLRNSRS